MSEMIMNDDRKKEIIIPISEDGNAPWLDWGTFWAKSVRVNPSFLKYIEFLSVSSHTNHHQLQLKMKGCKS